MNAARERLEFAPPPTPGLVRAMLLAILAHGILVTILTLGVKWKHEASPVSAEAELWSATAMQAAAPAPLPTPPAEAPPPTPEPKPAPKPEPVEQPKPVPQPDPAIALAKEKEKAKQLKEKQAAQEKLALEKKNRERQEQEKAKKEKEKAALAKAEKDKADKAEKDKAAKDKATKLAQDEAKRMEEFRKDNLKRMAGMAGTGGNGDAGSTGTAAQSSGPSASYAGRIRGRIKPNITYIETIVGNPTTEIEVRTSPDGTIINRKIVKASGTKSWDDAALNAIDKTAKLPPDENGKVPPALIIVLSPQELIGR